MPVPAANVPRSQRSRKAWIASPDKVSPAITILRPL